MNNEWQYHLVKGISWLVCRLPYKLILLIGACLGPVYGLIAKKQKLRGINNIKIGMNMNDQEAEQLISCSRILAAVLWKYYTCQT